MVQIIHSHSLNSCNTSMNFSSHVFSDQLVLGLLRNIVFVINTSMFVVDESRGNEPVSSMLVSILYMRLLL